VASIPIRLAARSSTVSPLPSLASSPMFKLMVVEQTVAEITSGVVSDDEQLRAFHARLVTTLKLPVLGLLGGRRVQIVTVEYLGNPRRGITLRAFEGDRTVTASILDLALPGTSAGALTLAGLKRWVGIPDKRPHDTRSSPLGRGRGGPAKVGSMHVRLRVLSRFREEGQAPLSGPAVHATRALSNSNNIAVSSSHCAPAQLHVDNALPPKGRRAFLLHRSEARRA
jgi:hypothetical protein